MGTRKNYIDISKGIGIFIIVLCHMTQGESLLRQFILSFCVAFFFVLSGYLFRNTDEKFLSRATKYATRLLIPLLVYGVIDLVVFTIYSYFTGTEITLMRVIKNIANVFFIGGHANMNGPLWYLIVLFWIDVIFLLVSKNKKILVAVNIVFIAAGYFVHFKGPWRVGQIPVCFVFFSIGYFSKAVMAKLEKLSMAIKLIAGIVLLGCFSVLAYFNGMTELASLNYGKNYVVYFITAIVITASIICFSMCINSNKILEFFGKNSLVVMCSHYYFARFLIPYIFEKMNKATLLENYLVEIALAAVIMVIMVPIIMVVNKYLPVLNGKVDLKFLKAKN